MNPKLTLVLAISTAWALAICAGCGQDSPPPTRTVQGPARTLGDILPPSAKAAGASAKYANQPQGAPVGATH